MYKQLQFEGLEDEALPLDAWTRKIECESLKCTAERLVDRKWEDVMLRSNWPTDKWAVVFRPHLEEYVQRVNLLLNRMEATIRETSGS